MDICEGGGRYSVWCHQRSHGHRVRVPQHYSLIEIDSALAGRRSRTLQKRREEERICRREYALILVARLNLPPQVATQIVLLAVPARAFNSGQACDHIDFVFIKGTSIAVLQSTRILFGLVLVNKHI